MDIKLEAPGHPNQEQLLEFYTNTLEKRYGGFVFIKAIDVKVKKSDDDNYHVSLAIKPEKGSMLYASDEHANEHKALKESIRKMNVQIKKYKSVHYHGHDKVDMSIMTEDSNSDEDIDF